MNSVLEQYGNQFRESLQQLAGILALVQEDPLTERQKELLAQCHSDLLGMGRAARDLVSVLAPEETGGAVERFRCGDLLRGLVGFAEPLAEEKGLVFHAHFEEGLGGGEIESNRPLLEDALRRILDAAIYATQRGAVQFAARRGHSAAGPQMVFEISDTAGPIGTEEDGDLDLDLIPANFGDRILALRKVRRQLETIQGTFVLENIGPGARVRITLPAGTVPDAPLPQAGVGRPILVVEDSDRAFQLIEVFAKPDGYDCSRATNGVEGVAKVKTGHYEAVIMDVRMPQMDGYTATQAIREWERESGRSPIPILLVSADDELRQLQMGRRAGCTAFLQKPITKTQLLSTLKMHLPVEVGIELN